MENKHFSLWIIVICIIIFILQLIIPGFTELFLQNQNPLEFWRFLTSIFLHGDIMHLLYNMLALGIFGSILEHIIGSKKFLSTFIISGIIANIIAFNFYPSSLGASGAIYGVIGTLIIIRPTLSVWAFGFPMPIFLAGILWAIGDTIGIFVPSNVGNIAHLSGLAVGLISGLFLRDWTKKPKQVVQLNEQEIRNWENSWMR
jgi:membrane associated rhomboid family serine protease